MKGERKFPNRGKKSQRNLYFRRRISHCWLM